MARLAAWDIMARFMSLLDDLWAKGDREAVYQRVLGLMFEAPVLFGGPESLRKPFLAEATKAWDAGSLLPRGRAARPIENALLFALRDVYAAWAAGLPVGAPDAGEDKLQVSGVLDDASPLDSGLLRLQQLGLRFVTPEEISAVAGAADKSVRDVLWGLSKAEHARRAANPDRARALDKFALARRAGKTAEELTAWAVVGREGAALTPGDMDAAIGWGPGTAGRRIAEARQRTLSRLLQGKPVYEPEEGGPAFEELSRFVDDDLPKNRADVVAQHVEGSMAATKATGRIARLAALVADATLGTWEPSGAPAADPGPAELAGWSAGGRTDIDERIASSAPDLARAVDVFRALAAREGRSLPPVPADALPKRTVSTAPAAAPADDAPKIRMRGWPGRLEVVNVPAGIKLEEDGHVKAFSWPAGERKVDADVSSSGGGIGVRVRVKAGDAPAGGVPCVVSAAKARRTFSTRPTDTTGEVVVRGMPLQSFRIEVDRTAVDVVLEE
jgi:hypothetical protein